MRFFDWLFRKKNQGKAPSELAAEGWPTNWAITDPRFVPTEIALEYVPFARIINLLSTKIADLITRDLHVVNRNGEVVETEHALQALRLLCESPDKRQSGHEFVKAIAADYLIDGNALVHVRKGMEAGLAKPSSPILRLRRLNILSASVRSSSPAMPMESLYYSAVAFGCTETEEIRAEEIAHARFFEPSSYARQSEGYIPFLFSKAPRACLTPALKIGLESDKWIANFYDEASKAGIVICFPAESDGDTQRRTIRQFREDTPKSRRPIVLFGGAQIAELNPSPANADARALRMDQVLEIARFYGLSPPSVAVNVTQWGSGIENLTRLDYRRCLEIHLANILAPLSHRMLPAGQYFEVSALQETRGDTKALTELANSAKPSQNGPAVFSRQEVRDQAGMRKPFVDDWDWEPSEPSEPAPAIDTGSESGYKDGDSEAEEMQNDDFV